MRLAVVGVEPEAEERGLDATAEQDDQDDGQSDEGLDVAVVGRRQVVGVDREQDDREDSRDETAEPVDRRLAAEAAQLRAQRAGRGRLCRGRDRIEGVDGLRGRSHRASSGGGGGLRDRRVEIEHAVGDLLGVVDALDVLP